MGKNIRVIAFLSFLMFIGCKKNQRINSSLWYSYDPVEMKYQEILLLNQDSAMRVFPLTFDGIKPSKLLINIGNDTYSIGEGVTLESMNSNQRILIETKNTSHTFFKHMNINRKVNLESIEDSFYIRYRLISKDTSDFFYETKTQDILRQN